MRPPSNPSITPPPPFRSEMSLSPTPSPHAATSALPTVSSDSNRPHSSASSRNRSFTDPDPSKLKIRKKIVVCCDGTWQDGLTVQERWKYTNVVRLSRAINHVDERFSPPMPQIVFYQSGVGTETMSYVALLDGAVGASLGDKVQEAYAFVAHNYEPGDEIFLFGFSRGAYTARMVADMIGRIGVLDRTDMDYFASIFSDLQKRGKTTLQEEIEALDKKLQPWTQDNSPGKLRANYDDSSYAIKCVGVFDTVGSLGLPEELTVRSQKIKTLFGFPDQMLGTHIERAYQALALNETRVDFTCNKFHQTPEGKAKGQVLNQCWFAGSHSDIGGGFQEHDLSDLTLFWMAGMVGDILSLDHKYLASLIQPSAPWGQQEPHDPCTGLLFSLADTIKRQLPTSYDPVTHEMIHASVRSQDTISPYVAELLKQHPELEATLLPLEEELKAHWKYAPTPPKTPNEPNDHGNKTAKVKAERPTSFLGRTLSALGRKPQGDRTVSSPAISVPPVSPFSSISPVSPSNPGSTRRGSWFLRKPSGSSGRASMDTTFSAFVRELMDPSPTK